MANTCYTNITFYSNDQTQIKRMFNVFFKLFTKNNNNLWFGDLANEYFKTEDLLPYSKTEKENLRPSDVISCRGSIIFMSSEASCVREDNRYTWWSFEIETETDWSVQIGLFREIIEKHYPDVFMAYRGEEPGCDVFIKYDSPDDWFYPEEYYLDWHDENKNSTTEYCTCNYFDTVDDVQEYIEKTFDVKVPSFMSSFEGLKEFLKTLFHDQLKVKNRQYKEIDIWLSEYVVVHPEDFPLLR